MNYLQLFEIIFYKINDFVDQSITDKFFDVLLYLLRFVWKYKDEIFLSEYIIAQLSIP